MIFATLALTLGAVVQDVPDPASTVSQMLSRYAGVKALSGTIRLTQTAGSETLVLDTKFQFEKPSKVFVLQTLRAQNPAEWMIVSDGKNFVYTLPDAQLGRMGQRLMEPVNQNGVLLGCKDIYFCGTYSLRDKSAPLDIAFGRIEDLRYIKNQWATLRFIRSETIEEEPVWVFGGQWRENGGAPITAEYRMFITRNYDLRKYVIFSRQAIPVPNRPGATQVVDIYTTYNVNFKQDGELDQALFQLPPP